ncbi:MAG: hypothetical protein MZV70_11160 [Desulfobacterales bacterium]|nr:hypothetical protein [Desulfobacterales bacterium]
MKIVPFITDKAENYLEGAVIFVFIALLSAVLIYLFFLLALSPRIIVLADDGAGFVPAYLLVNS